MIVNFKVILTNGKTRIFECGEYENDSGYGTGKYVWMDVLNSDGDYEEFCLIDARYYIGYNLIKVVVDKLIDMYGDKLKEYQYVEINQ